jgi:hypothetical protein
MHTHSCCDTHLETRCGCAACVARNRESRQRQIERYRGPYGQLLKILDDHDTPAPPPTRQSR